MGESSSNVRRLRWCYTSCQVELGRQGWAGGKGNNTGQRQTGKEEQATAEFELLKLKLEEKEREVKLEVDKLGGMKQDRDQKVEEVKNLNKAIAGLKRNKEAVKEKREMEQKIEVFKKTLETGSAADQGDAKHGKTEEEKMT